MNSSYYIKNIFIISIIIIATSVSCKHTKKQIHFTFNNNIENIQIPEFKLVKTDSILNDKLSYVDFMATDTGLIVFGSDFDSYKLFIYNLETEFRHVIELDSTTTFILAFKYINNDSILILNNDSYKFGYHDSTFIWTNYEGEVWKYLSLKGLPVKSIENPEYMNNDEAAWWVPNFYGSIVYTDDRLAVQFRRNIKYFGDPFYGNNLPILGLMNLKTGVNTLTPIRYPDYIQGTTIYGRQNDIFFTSPSETDDAFLVSFKHTPKILRYHYNTDVIDTFNCKSTIYDTIFPFENETIITKGSDINMPYPIYFGLQYNSYRKEYYRLIQNPKDYGFEEYSIQIADTNLNLIAEGFLPKTKSGKVQYAGEYIIHFAKANDPNYLKLEFYKMTFRPGTNQELIAQIKAKQTKGKPQVPQTATKYIKENVKPNAENYTVVFQITGFTCGGVTEFLLDFFSQSNAKFKENEVLLVLDTQDPKTIRERLTANNLQPETNPNIIIDSLSTYSNTLPANDVHEMPRIVVVRKSKVVTDTVFSLSDEENTGEFQKFIINSGKEQLRLKK